MIGGLFTSFTMELLVYPAVYLLWKWHAEVKKAARIAGPQSPTQATPVGISPHPSL
jgi:Cu(I)/Ag(I) efflux system membrane protein CusA/SilA